MKKIDDISYEIIGAAYNVHRGLGPGLLESSYEACLIYELRKKGLKVEAQKVLPIVYEKVRLDAGYRIDLLVEDVVIVELKAVEKVIPIYKAQLMTYLKLSNLRLGLLLNFNELDMKKGITRVVM